jgi:Ser/Thr protein kinase RdoA (MazF antagonist)
MSCSTGDNIDRILAEYPSDCRPWGAESLGSAGGFSGARFWRLDSPRGKLCLRRWPAEHPSRERLTFIHAVLDHVHTRGFTTIPVPIRTLAGESCCAIDGHLWEMTDWLPGVADYETKPTPAKLEAAMSTLARWHLSAADFPLADRAPRPSSGIESRFAHLYQLRPGVLARLSIDAEIMGAKKSEWSGLTGLANRLIAAYFRVEPAVRAKLGLATSVRVSFQPCIRDIWSDHVLFEGDSVSGIIDFGAMRMETVAGDVARLLGSLAGDDLLAWQLGLAAYHAIRPLSDDEAALLPVFDESTMLLAGFNWLEWIIIAQRQFENPPEVIRRLTMIVSRLEILSNSLARRA